MFGDVCERLLRNTVDSQAFAGRERTKIAIHDQFHVHSRARVLLNQRRHVRGGGEWSEDGSSPRSASLRGVQQP